MAMGIFPGAGGVKEAKEIYLGAGGVKTVKEVYVGQGGSVKKVWPAYTDYGGSTVNMLSKSLISGYRKYDAVGDLVSNSSGSIGSSSANTGFWSGSSGCIGGSSENVQITSTHRDCCHMFYTISDFDTRGYNYILARFMMYLYSGNTTSGRARPFISYGSTFTDNLTQYSGYLTCTGRSSTGDVGSYGFYVLFDISNMMQESTTVNFGCQLWTNSDSSRNGCLYMDNVSLCQDKPSQDVALTLTWGS